MHDVLPKSLPQSDSEWQETADFETGFVPVDDEKIQYAYLAPDHPSEHMVIMVGGVPRNPERQSRLPLINKLYGSIALQAAHNGIHSLMYQQVGTGQSSGDLLSETLQTRTTHLTEVVSYFRQSHSIGRVSLIGMSLGSYLAARAATHIEAQDTEVSHLVLQSPAAYPLEAEGIPYGSAFKDVISKPWPASEAPVFEDILNYLRRGGSVTVSYFERDEPPIPKRIQEAYTALVNSAMQEELHAAAYSIAGLEHNFRRIGSDHNGNIVHNGAVKAVASQISELIS